MEDQLLIQACRRQDRKAQKLLYEQLAPEMFGVCKRYIRKREDAEDVLVEAFFKILSNIGSFKGEGSFKGWARRIVVNECLMFLRKRDEFRFDIGIEDWDAPIPESFSAALTAQDILNQLDRLAPGYRTIFNLYVIEGYKHREIAEMLGISINTSKSQLILARRRMQELLGMEFDMPDYITELSDQEEI
jgi:RNA polymerase sigma factor (sigma-70 family)